MKVSVKGSSSAVRVEGKLSLSKIDPDDIGVARDKNSAVAQLEALREQIAEQQNKLYAEGKRSLLLVFQAMDTGGKDGAVKSLLTGVNPEGIAVTSFKVPSAEDLAHDFLWRIHQRTPARGMIGVWNRSHYEDVLVTRVHKLIDKATWETRYKDITAFEKLLVDSGTACSRGWTPRASTGSSTRATSRSAPCGTTTWKPIKTRSPRLRLRTRRGSWFRPTRSGRATWPSRRSCSTRSRRWTRTIPTCTSTLKKSTSPEPRHSPRVKRCVQPSEKTRFSPLPQAGQAAETRPRALSRSNLERGPM